MKIFLNLPKLLGDLKPESQPQKETQAALNRQRKGFPLKSKTIKIILAPLAKPQTK